MYIYKITLKPCFNANNIVLSSIIASMDLPDPFSALPYGSGRKWVWAVNNSHNALQIDIIPSLKLGFMGRTI